MLQFDHDGACWSWDLDRIHAKGYTDNVVELMVGKVNRLPIETQLALQKLACLGNIAAVAMLSIVLETPEAQVHAMLWPAVRQELVERQEGSYKFIHDRVQEAAYSLIPEDSRAAAHLRIGRLLAGADATGAAGGSDLRHRQSAEPWRGADHRSERNGTNSPSST